MYIYIYIYIYKYVKYIYIYTHTHIHTHTHTHREAVLNRYTLLFLKAFKNFFKSYQIIYSQYFC